MTQASRWGVGLHVSSLILHIELLGHLQVFTAPEVLPFILIPVVVLIVVCGSVQLIRPLDSLSQSCQLNFILTDLFPLLDLRLYGSCSLE